MAAPELVRSSSCGVTLLGDPRRPGGVTFGFTERTGGVSTGCFTSLNLGLDCGDDDANVMRNRQLVLASMGAAELLPRLVNPVQVHGDTVLVIDGAYKGTPADPRPEADAIVCTCRNVAVLLCFADCVPVVLAAPRGFAVVHSGWRGTIARIAGKALRVLVEQVGCDASQVCAYVGPCVGGDDYEVSDDLVRRFSAEFGCDVVAGNRLDLPLAVEKSLVDEGLAHAQIARAGVSTVTHTDRFFSYRAENGACGRHGAVAFMK